jgi:hypothetical protein
MFSQTAADKPNKMKFILLQGERELVAGNKVLGNL